MNFEEENNEEALDEFLISDLIAIIYKSYKNYLIHQLTELEVTPGQIPFILELMHSKSTYQSDLTEKLFLSRAVTAKTLKKLDEKHIIERRIAGDNRRKNKVWLTEKGEKIASKIDKIEKNWDKELLKNLDENAVQIKKILEALAKNSLDSIMDKINELNNCGDIKKFHKAFPFEGHPFKGQFFRDSHPQMDFFRNRENLRKKTL